MHKIRGELTILRTQAALLKTEIDSQNHQETLSKFDKTISRVASQLTDLEKSLRSET